MRAARVTTLTICAGVLAANAWHIARNRMPPLFDDAWYLETSFRIFQACKAGILPGLRAYVEAFQVKAPLIAVLPLPLYAFFGTGERVALWVNEAAFAAILVFVYLIARRLYNERAGLYAAVAAALLPLFYGLSRVYLLETALTALVAASAWAMLKIRPNDNRQAAGRGLLLGLGLLAKFIFPMYLLGPAWLRRRSLASGARMTLYVGLGLAAPWYVYNVGYVVGLSLMAGFGGSSTYYRHGSLWLTAEFNYLASLGADALSWPYLFSAAIILALAWRLRRKSWTWGPSEQFLAAWFLIPAAICFMGGTNKQIRYLAPALPALAIFIGAALASWAEEVRAGWLFLLLIPPGLVFTSQTFGVPPAASLVNNGPPQAGPFWDRAAVLAAVAPAARPDSVIAVGIEHPLFNANNMACLAASRGYAFHFVNINGYAQASVENALIRLKDKDADMLVMVRGVPAQELVDLINRANAGLQQRLDAGRLPARRLAEVPLKSGITAEVYSLRP